MQVPYFDNSGKYKRSNNPTINQVLLFDGTDLLFAAVPEGSAPVTSVAGRTGAIILVAADITDFSSAGTAIWLPKAGGAMSGTINSQAIIPIASLSYSLGDSTHLFTANYTQQVLNPSGSLSIVAGGSNSIIFNVNNVVQGRIYPTGNRVSQNGGTYADGGYREDIKSAGTNGYLRAGNLLVDASGQPIANTPSLGDNSTKIATTAFVLANAGGGGSGVTRLISYIATVFAGTSVGDLFTYTIPANTMSADGMLLDVSYEGDLGSLGTYQYELFFAGTSIYSLPSTALPGGIHTNLSIHFKVYRQSSSTVYCKGEVTTALGSVVNIQPIAQIVSSVNFSAANIIKIAGASSTAGQLLLHAGSIVFYP